MKILQINSHCGSGSTGKICLSVSKLLCDREVENYILYVSGKSDIPSAIRYMKPYEIKFQAVKSRLLGKYGAASSLATKRLIREIDRISPDVIHLHNLHGHNCNFILLFEYLKKRNIRLFWTFHDCWAFTGYCPYYDISACEKWKESCHHCPEYKKYSWIFDRSAYLYEKKKHLFLDTDFTIITPSNWLAEEARKSFLGGHEIKVIHNGIDLSIFMPKYGNFRQRMHCQDKFIILGVAFQWGKRKGLDVFIDLAKRLDERFQIVLVGTNEKVDQLLPKNVISIHRTQNQAELAEIYTAADLFLNPTREENFPTVHLESLACGTPILSFDTGGCGETFDATCGAMVPKNDVEGMYRKIMEIFNERPFTTELCLEYAKNHDQQHRFLEYISLYES